MTALLCDTICIANAITVTNCSEVLFSHLFHVMIHIQSISTIFEYFLFQIAIFAICILYII